MIILNEKEYVEELLFDKRLGEIPVLSLNLIAKYLRQYKGLTYKKIFAQLDEFMKSCCVGYNPLEWHDCIDTAAKNANKRDLREIDGVWITKTELEAIQGIKQKTFEKLAFTLLCLAKYGNVRNENNNNWVNFESKEIYKLARVSCNKEERERRLGKLCDSTGLISFAKNINNLSIHVEFVDDEGEKAFFVSDFRELGYEYLLRCKGENFIRCNSCGILTRGNKNGTKKYCKNCMGYVPELTRRITCVDCGKEFIVLSNIKNKTRCDKCQSEYSKQYFRDYRRKERESKN